MIIQLYTPEGTFTVNTDAITDEELAELNITRQNLNDYLAQFPPEPPHSTHISVLTAVDVSKARPAQVKRKWEGKDYYYDCFVTETVKDQYQAGNIQVGDYVLVHFDDIGEQIVTAKVFKSWG